MTYSLPQIFMVIATQNPIELQGTYPLPEAQLDRFFMRINMGYPSTDQEVTIMEMQAKEHPIQSISPVASESAMKTLQDAVKEVFIGPPVKRYIVELVNATRKHPHLMLGASPRGSLGLMRAAQALALARGMEFAEPSLIKHILKPVLSHRIIVKPQSRLGGVTAEKVLDEIMSAIPVPV
jgi:MoxR-like ATPase